MRVIVTAGGTGGHIYPALAIVQKIREMEPDSEILYIGTHNRMEKDIVPKSGIPYEPIEIYGLSTSIKLMPRNVKNVFLINKAYHKCLKIMKEFRPDVVIGVGGYVTYPVIKAAHKSGVKTFIHEQNSIPGKANKVLLKYTDLVGVSFKDSVKYFSNSRVVVTGNPCSENALKTPKSDKCDYGLSRNKPGILIFNGSLGSEAMNKKMLEFLEDISDEVYEVLYITGKNYYRQFKNKKFSKNVKVVPYVDNLSGLMKDMDLIVSRAGASSVAEITALALPCILIPSPYVANNHQYYNAQSIVKANAGVMIEEKDLNKDTLKESIDKILKDQDYRKTMQKNLKALSIDNSATLIYNELKKLISK